MILILLFVSVGQAAVKIQSVNLSSGGDPSEMTVRAESTLEMEQPSPGVYVFKNAVLDTNQPTKIEPSSLSLVQQATLTQQDAPPQSVTLSLKVKEGSDQKVTQDGGVVKITISTPDEGGTSPHLKEYLSDRKAGQFKGRPISLQVRDVEVGDVLRLIGETSGFNIIVGDNVKGKLTLSLIDVPWDHALDVVLHTLHLGAERSHNILRIETLENLTSEKVQEYKATLASRYAAPRITRVFPINYANLKELLIILQKFQSSAAGTADAVVSDPSLIQIDDRTNSVIVHDLPENVDRIQKVIAVLDTQTPQVLIESKMVEATESFSKTISGSLGFGTKSQTNPFLASFSGGDPLDSLIGKPGVFEDGVAFSKLSAASGALGVNNGTFGLSPSLSFLPGIGKLNALLSWGEGEDLVKIISSPKTVVMNKAKATIVEGTPVLVPGTTTVAGVGTVQTASVQSANIGLEVTPTVTNDGSVLLELQVNKDVPLALSGGGGAQGIGQRFMKSVVLVESGSTLVIGGIYTAQTSKSSSGIPFLRKLPIIGSFFGSDSTGTSRSELFFFITPRILNPKDAGMTKS